MRIVRVVPRSGRIISLILFVSAPIVAGVIFFICFFVVEEIFPLIIAGIVVLVTDIPLGLYFYHRYKRINRMINDFMAVLEGVSGDKILFRDSIIVEYGLFEAIGKWVSSGRSSSYVVESRYEKLFNAVPTSSIDLGFFRERGYLIAVNKDGSGKIVLPIARIVDERYKDLCLVYIDKSMNKLAEKQYTLSVKSSYGDTGYASVRTSKDLLYGNLVFSSAGKARSARLELRVVYNGRKARSIRQIIAKTRSSINFQYKLFPEEPILIVSSKHSLNPNNLTINLKTPRPFTAGFCCTNIVLRLVLDLPLRRDVYTEVNLATNAS